MGSNPIGHPKEVERLPFFVYLPALPVLGIHQIHIHEPVDFLNQFHSNTRLSADFVCGVFGSCRCIVCIDRLSEFILSSKTVSKVDKFCRSI